MPLALSSSSRPHILGYIDPDSALLALAGVSRTFRELCVTTWRSAAHTANQQSHMVQIPRGILTSSSWRPVNLVCDVGLIYEPLIIRYARPEALITSPILLRPDAVLTVLISTPTQLFVAWRLHVITRSYFLSLTIALLAIVALGGGISTSAIVSFHPDFARFPTFKPEVITWLVASSACDVVLTASLVFWKRKTNMAGTDSYLNKIIRSCLDMPFYVLIPNTTYLNARPWRESPTEYNAPNVLFESTVPGSNTSGSRSRGPTFSILQTGSAIHGHGHAQRGGQGLTYPPSPNNTVTAVNVNVATESFIDMAPHAYGQDSDKNKDVEIAMESPYVYEQGKRDRSLSLSGNGLGRGGV
ncbi:hypothetical protein C8F01DRAFT_1375707 [Mycena amicta]|nr:hypothetical protein C8F01DRAFT_1375707 [Mycena amicta]